LADARDVEFWRPTAGMVECRTWLRANSANAGTVTWTRRVAVFYCSGVSSEERLNRSGGDQPWPTRSCITFLAVRRTSTRNPIAAVHPGKSGLPAGQIFHAAGPSAGGWTIMAVHDSKESWERFRDQVLMPRMKQGIEGGLVGPPQETAFEVHNLQK